MLGAVPVTGTSQTTQALGFGGQIQLLHLVPVPVHALTPPCQRQQRSGVSNSATPAERPRHNTTHRNNNTLPTEPTQFLRNTRCVSTQRGRRSSEVQTMMHVLRHCTWETGAGVRESGLSRRVVVSAVRQGRSSVLIIVDLRGNTPRGAPRRSGDQCFLSLRTGCGRAH